MSKHLESLLATAKNFVLTSEEKEQQLRSCAYGNTVIENSRITREMVDRAAGNWARELMELIGLAASCKPNPRIPSCARPLAAGSPTS